MIQKNYIKRIVFISILHLIISVSLSVLKAQAKVEQKLEWHTDLLKANEVSKKTNKPIFAFFTGSDWCIWCKRLQADVFAKKEFIEWAQKNVVLLEVDFPRYKTLPPEQAQQNNGLQQTFSIAGYPTIWMFNLTQNDTAKNFNINTLGSLGYPAGAEPGKEEVKFLNDANAFLKKK